MSDRGVVEAQIALSRKKSQIIGLLLTFFLGPFGLLYSSVIGAVVLLLFVGAGTILTIGFGLPVVWSVSVGLSMLWSLLAIAGHNRRCEQDALRSV